MGFGLKDLGVQIKQYLQMIIIVSTPPLLCSKDITAVISVLLIPLRIFILLQYSTVADVS